MTKAPRLLAVLAAALGLLLAMAGSTASAAPPSTSGTIYNSIWGDRGQVYNVGSETVWVYSSYTSGDLVPIPVQQTSYNVGVRDVNHVKIHTGRCLWLKMMDEDGNYGFWTKFTGPMAKPIGNTNYAAQAVSC